MKYVVFAWLQFIVGLLILGSGDYYVRWRDGWLGNRGMPTPDAVWFGVPLLLGVVGLVLLWQGTAAFRRSWTRVIVVAVQALLGFAVYVAACLWYVVGTGVDSL